MESTSVEPADFEYLREFIRSKAAIVLEPGKAYLVESRLIPLAKEVGLPSLSELVKALRAGGANGLAGKVVDAMTTNETSFFRDRHPFDALQEHVLPKLIQGRAATKTLNLWCGASSYGQEPYTVAMIIKESFPLLATWKIDFQATDLCSQVLKRAQEGVYSQLEVNRGMPASLLVKYFQRRGLNWAINDNLKSLIRFRQLNLLDPWGFGPLDIVFLRNVLIYFDLETKRMILGKIRKLLRKDGYLFLGGAETTLNIDDQFVRVPVGKTCVYQPG